MTSVVARTLLPPPAHRSDVVDAFIRVAAPRILLRRVRLIDGTGSPAKMDTDILVEDGKIRSIVESVAAVDAANVMILDLEGHTVLPGLVGMHNHMFYVARPNLDAAGHSEGPFLVPQMTFTSPRLYLAGGVTTLRTAGSVEPYTDLNMKQQIDAGELPGPHIDVTGPYLDGAGSRFIQMHQLSGPEDARRLVAFWAEQGVTSFKAYQHITRAQLRAALEEAHDRGIKVTGHLGSVTYPEAAELGIDNIEHGFFLNTQLDEEKTPDVCPSTRGTPTLLAMDANSRDAEALICLLVSRQVAITSTLPVFEQLLARPVPMNPRALAMLSAPAREAYIYARSTNSTARDDAAIDFLRAYENGMALERRFVAAEGCSWRVRIRREMVVSSRDSAISVAWSY